MSIKSVYQKFITAPLARYIKAPLCKFVCTPIKRFVFAPIGCAIAWVWKKCAPVYMPLWRATEPLRKKWNAFWTAHPKMAKVLRVTFRWIFRLIKWIISLVLILILVILLGGTGPLVKHVVFPIANSIGVPISVERFALYPLGGYIQIKNLQVNNPTLFTEGDEVYVEQPLLKIGEFTVDVEMSSLLSDEYVVDIVRLSGLRCLYAFDYDTTNVDALVAQIVGEKDPETEVAEEVHEEVQAGKVEQDEAKAEEPAEPEEEAKPLRFRIHLFDISDNSIAMRNGNYPVPMYLPIALPPMTMHDVDNETLREELEPTFEKCYWTYEKIVGGLGELGEKLGEGFKAAEGILGDGLKATGGVLNDGATGTGEALKSSGEALKGLFNKR